MLTEKVTIQSKKNSELINVTDKVSELIAKSKIKEGFVQVFTLHTSSAMLINEDEPGLEEDISDFMLKLVPEEGTYRHHHFFPQDGRPAINAWAHIRSCLLGSHVALLVFNGELFKGGRQNIYFVELDGPKRRSFVVQVVGAV